jgi:hypothetical protein
MTHDVFISYPSKDKTVADAVCAKLEEQKIRCWIAPRDIPAGKNFAEAIIDAIDTSKVFVLIWSVNTNTSSHILNEINQAFNQGIPIIPFRIQEVEPTSAMRYYFGRTHWLDALTPPLEKHIDILVNSVLSNLDQTPEEISAPVKVEVEPENKKSHKQESETTPPVIISGQSGIEKSKKKQRTPSAGMAQPNRKKKIKIIIPVAAAMLVIAALVVIYLATPLISDPFNMKLGAASPTIPITPTLTKAAPTATITPTSIPAWIQEANAWANPILTAIKSQPPDFADDFSQLDSEWSISSRDRCPNFDSDGKFMVVNQELLLGISTSCPFFAFTHPKLNDVGGGIVLRTDINFEKSAISYEIIVGDENQMLTDFILSRGGWALTIPIPGVGDQMQTVQEDPFPESLTGQITLTILKDETTFLYYLDDTLLISYSIPGDETGTLFINFGVSNWSDESFKPEIITLDNIQFWDIDNLFIPERILAQVENETPAFADDFSQVDTNWQIVDNQTGTEMPDYAGLDINGGVMKLFMWEIDGMVLTHPDLNFKNYVLQVDVTFLNDPIDMEFRTWVPSAPEYYFALSSNAIWKYYERIGDEVLTENIDDIPPSIEMSLTKPNTLTIINSSPNYVVFLDSTLVFSHVQQFGSGKDFSTLDFQIISPGLPERRPVVELDNIKVWDLDG